MCIRDRYDLDLDLVTFILDLDLDVLKLHLRAENKVLSQGFQSESRNTLNTDRCGQTYYHVAFAVIKMKGRCSLPPFRGRFGLFSIVFCNTIRIFLYFVYRNK